MMGTYFEYLEHLLLGERVKGLANVNISDVEEAMVKDQHQLFHDAEFAEGCPICRKEREENQ